MGRTRCPTLGHSVKIVPELPHICASIGAQTLRPAFSFFALRRRPALFFLVPVLFTLPDPGWCREPKKKGPPSATSSCLPEMLFFFLYIFFHFFCCGCFCLFNWLTRVCICIHIFFLGHVWSPYGGSIVHLRQQKNRYSTSGFFRTSSWGHVKERVQMSFAKYLP